MDIRLENISFSYGDTEIIRQLSCDFASGKFYAVLGPNGSGKTTLLDIICGFLTPDQGRVFLNGTPISSVDKKERAKKISLVSQNFYVNFPFHVEEIVLMGRHPYIGRFSHASGKDFDRVEAVMAASGISHLKHRNITQLSGGEKQRCVFARALCQDTPVLLLDEAFSNMDIKHTFHLLGLVKKAVRESRKTVIAVLHDINLAACFSDAMLFLKNGSIMDFGDTETVLTRETIETVFNVESTVEYNDYVQAKQVYFKPYVSA